MPRKSTASVAATETNGDISMVSEAPAVSSPKQLTDQAQSDKQEKQGKRRSEGDVIALEVSPSSTMLSTASSRALSDRIEHTLTISQDLSLPKSIIQRISKGVLPANTSISKDAILALTKSATVFISHLAGEANDMTDRKTIQSQDVIKALKEIEMENVMGLGMLGKDGRRGGRVEREVEKWEGDVRGKRRGYREKVKARESGVGDTTVGTLDTEGGEGDGDGEERDRENEAKRIRIDDDDGRYGSAGPIVTGTNQLKLNVGRRKSDEVDDGEGDEAGDDAEEDESEQEGENEEEEEQEELQNGEEIDEESDSRRKNDTLAPDGRIEVGGSDDDSE